MASKLECKRWFEEPKHGSPEQEILYGIYDILAVRVVQEEIGKAASKNETNWPKARILRHVGNLCMRDYVNVDQMVKYVTLCHERGQPVTKEDGLPSYLGEFLVSDYIRRDSGWIFTFEGRRKLHSLAKELDISPIDLFGALAVLLHKLADELATCCGPEAQG